MESIPINPAITPQQASEAFLPTRAVSDSLASFVMSNGAAKKLGYIRSQLSPQDIDAKWRCWRCTKSLPTRYWNPERRQARLKGGPRRSKEKNELITAQPSAKPDHRDKDKDQTCSFHSGRIVNRTWTCCKGNHFAKPCSLATHHEARRYAPGEFERNWLYYATPPPDATTKKRAAIVLDCEMGTASTGESELIRLTVIDFFTRETLLDSLVFPSVPMAHYNTRFSGVTFKAMDNARRNRTCLFGRDAARQAIWAFADADTFVVAHGGNGDMTSLRWIHTRMIDTLDIETRLWKKAKAAQEAAQESLDEEMEQLHIQEEQRRAEVAEQTGVPAEPVVTFHNAERPEIKLEHPGLSLKTLAKARLDRTIQNTKTGHDSLEDALATRDVLAWHVLSELLQKSE